MHSKEFEQVIKNVDPRFSVVPNPARPGLCNIFFDGRNYDLPVISEHLIKEELDHSHRYEFPNGMNIRHHSQKEILARLEDFIKIVNEGKLDEIYG